MNDTGKLYKIINIRLTIPTVYFLAKVMVTYVELILNVMQYLIISMAYE